MPLLKPPYAHLVALDLNRGDIAWKVPFGDAPVPQGVKAPDKGGDVIVGMRPEHFEDAAVAGEGHNWLKFRACGIQRR